jgi:hypothetical protein
MDQPAAHPAFTLHRPAVLRRPRGEWIGLDA